MTSLIGFSSREVKKSRIDFHKLESPLSSTTGLLLV
jgi:hypothetical protein